MVRINRTYSIEQDLVERLKEEGNNSELINNLLNAHFNRLNSKDIKAMRVDLDEIEGTIDNLRRERDRKADAIRDLEAQTEYNKQEIEETEAEKEKAKDVLKNIYSLIKDKKLTFEEFRRFKDASNFEELNIKLYESIITLEEYLSFKDEYIKDLNKEDLENGNRED